MLLDDIHERMWKMNKNFEKDQVFKNYSISKFHAETPTDIV